MTNLELLNKIKAEIERLKNRNAEWRERIDSEDGYSYESDVCCGYEEAIEDFETFISSLPEEKSSEDSKEDILLLERAWLTLDHLGHEELAERLKTFKEKYANKM